MHLGVTFVITSLPPARAKQTELFEKWEKPLRSPQRLQPRILIHLAPALSGFYFPALSILWAFPIPSSPSRPHALWNDQQLKWQVAPRSSAELQPMHSHSSPPALTELTLPSLLHSLLSPLSALTSLPKLTAWKGRFIGSHRANSRMNNFT